MAKWSFRKIGAREVAAASLLGALAALWEIIPGPPFDIPFPIYPRISWDLTGIPMMISLLLYGPVSGIYTSLIGCSIIFLRGNFSGGIFKLTAELATLLGFALIKNGAVLKSILAIGSRVAAMTVANFFLLQIFYAMPEPMVVGLLAPIGLFNVTQALINIVPAYLICSRISKSRKQGQLMLCIRYTILPFDGARGRERERVVSPEELQEFAPKLPPDRLIVYGKAGHGAYLERSDRLRKNLLELHNLAEQQSTV